MKLDLEPNQAREFLEDARTMLLNIKLNLRRDSNLDQYVALGKLIDEFLKDFEN